MLNQLIVYHHYTNLVTFVNRLFFNMYQFHSNNCHHFSKTIFLLQFFNINFSPSFYRTCTLLRRKKENGTRCIKTYIGHASHFDLFIVTVSVINPFCRLD